MKKVFKTKRKNERRVFIYLIIFTLSFVCFIKLITKDSDVDKEYLLTNLLGEITGSDSAFLGNIKEKITSPKYIIYDGLNKIVDKNNLSVFSSIIEDDFNYNEASSDYVIDPSPTVIKDPIVYIYNTHQLEEYSSLTPYDYSVKPNVMIASYILREKLNEMGISTIVETNNIKEYLENNNMNYNDSYHASEYFAREAEKKYPTIKYLIDIHRDSALKNSTYLETGGVGYAKVIFISGMEHTKSENNIGFAEEFNIAVNNKLNGISRGVIKKDEEPVYGEYNPNLNGKSVLIEVGGIDNKIEEVYNTMGVIASALKTIIESENE